jgi:hypothetical protein
MVFNKNDCHNITEILLKVGLNTTKQTNKQKHITTKVGSLNPAHREVYLIQYFDPTFNNISVILWQSFLLVEET